MRIDLKQLLSELPDERVVEIVQSLGADRYVDKGNYVIFPTICHNDVSEEASMKLYYYKENKAFHCYTDCGETFNLIGLFERRYQTLGYSYNFYTDIILRIIDTVGFAPKEGFNVAYQSNMEKYNLNKIEVHVPEIPSHILNVFIFYPTEQWLKEGISESAMKIFNILHSPRQNKIIIPHYDENNRLIGIRGRALLEDDIELGKYRPVTIEGKLYNHPLGYNLYGLNLNAKNIAKQKTAIVFEGEKSILLFESIYGRDNNISVAVCGNSISRYQIDLLRQAGAEKIIIAFDNVAKQEKIKQLEKMNKMCDKYKYIIKIGYIMDFQNLLGEKDSPIDLGKRTFEILMKHIIWR